MKKSTRPKSTLARARVIRELLAGSPNTGIAAKTCSVARQQLHAWRQDIVYDSLCRVAETSRALPPGVVQANIKLVLFEAAKAGTPSPLADLLT